MELFHEDANLMVNLGRSQSCEWNLLAGAHFIERVGAPDERRISGSGLLALRGTKVSYLSLLIVKHPHRIRGERIKGCLRKGGPQPIDLETA